MTPRSPAATSVSTIPRFPASSAIAASARMANCQVSRNAPVSRIAAPRIAPIAAGPAPSRNARAFWLVRNRSNRRTADQDERERRGERHDRCQHTTGEAVRGVADRGDGRDDRPGGDLPERDRVEELRVGHPMVGVHRVALHQRDDHEPPTERQRANFERRPRERADPTDRHRPGHQQPERSELRRATRDQELDGPAGQQREHEVGAEQCRGRRADHQIGDPAANPRPVNSRPVQARTDQPSGGLNSDGRDCRPRPGAGAARPTAAASSRGIGATARGSGRPPER